MPTVSKTPCWTGTPVIQERTVRVNVASRLPTSCFLWHCTMGMSARGKLTARNCKDKVRRGVGLGQREGSRALGQQMACGKERKNLCIKREFRVMNKEISTETVGSILMRNNLVRAGRGKCIYFDTGQKWEALTHAEDPWIHAWSSHFRGELRILNK